MGREHGACRRGAIGPDRPRRRALARCIHPGRGRARLAHPPLERRANLGLRLRCPGGAHAIHLVVVCADAGRPLWLRAAPARARAAVGRAVPSPRRVPRRGARRDAGPAGASVPERRRPRVRGAPLHPAGQRPGVPWLHPPDAGPAPGVDMIPRILLLDVAHVAVFLLLPPLLLGVINKTKAAFAGRVGPPLLQPYYDLVKLFRKDSVFSNTTSWVFRAGPVVGAAREATFSCLAEPALFLGLLALVRTSGSLSLSTMLGAGLGAEWTSAGASLLMVIVSLFIVILAECSRIPVDDPTTHLELTMIHEVMVLDHSGPALGLIEYGAASKLFVLGVVVTRIAAPYEGANAWVNWGLFLAAISALAVVIGVVESVMARLRLIQVPSLLVAANLLSGFGIVLLAR